MTEVALSPEDQTGPFIETLENGLLRYELKSMPRLRVAFSTRELFVPGVDPASTALKALDSDNAGHLLERSVRTGSNHGADISVIDGDDALSQIKVGVDGYVVRAPDTPIIIPVADCPIVLFAYNGSQVCGAVHAGWCGVCAGAVQELLAAFEVAVDATFENANVLITPYADANQYEVTVEDIPGEINVLGKFKEALDIDGQSPLFSPDMINAVFKKHPTNPTKAYLDVGLAINFILESAGVPPDRITVSRYRTMRDEQLWSSRLQLKELGWDGKSPRPDFNRNVMCAYIR